MAVKRSFKDLMLSMKNEKLSEDIDVKSSVYAFLVNEASEGQRKRRAGDSEYGGGPVFHPSSLSYFFCDRKEVIKWFVPQIFPYPAPPDPDLYMIFQLGHAIHRMVQEDMFGKMGWLYGFWEKPGEEKVEGFMPGPGWTYVEPKIFYSERRIGGHCDGILYPKGLDGPCFLLEIKSINGEGYEFLKEARKAHKAQAQLYMNSEMDLEVVPKITKTLFCYFNKNTSRMKWYWMEKYLEILNPMLDFAESTVKDIEAKSLPPIRRLCKRKGSKDAKNCTACELCFSFGEGKEALLELIKYGEYQ